MIKSIEEQLLDKIDEWHDDISITISLHEYLGMNWEQYKKYVKDNNFGQCYYCNAILKENQKAISLTILDTKWFCCNICVDNYINSK